MLEGGGSTKVPGTDLSFRELICSKFGDICEKLGTPPRRAIKRDVNLLPDSVPPTKS